MTSPTTDEINNQFSAFECLTCSDIVSFEGFSDDPSENKLFLCVWKSLQGQARKYGDTYVTRAHARTHGHVSRAKQMLHSKLHTEVPKEDLLSLVLKICNALHLRGRTQQNRSNNTISRCNIDNLKYLQELREKLAAKLVHGRHREQKTTEFLFSLHLNFLFVCLHRSGCIVDTLSTVYIIVEERK